MSQLEPFNLNKDDMLIFINEKVAALESLDEGKIRRFCERWGLDMPSDADTLWTGIHIARALDYNVSRDKRADSALWCARKGINLKDHLE